MFPLNNTFYIVWTMFCTKFFGRVYWMLYYWFRLFCHANKSHRNSYGESESIQTNKNYFMRLKFFSFRVWFVCATALQRCIAIKYNAILYYVEIRKQIDSWLFFFGGNRLNLIFLCFVMSAFGVTAVRCECDTNCTRIGSLPSFPSPNRVLKHH